MPQLRAYRLSGGSAESIGALKLFCPTARTYRAHCCGNLVGVYARLERLRADSDRDPGRVGWASVIEGVDGECVTDRVVRPHREVLTWVRGADALKGPGRPGG